MFVIPSGDGWSLHVIYRLLPDYSLIGSESGYAHHTTPVYTSYSALQKIGLLLGYRLGRRPNTRARPHLLEVTLSATLSNIGHTPLPSPVTARPSGGYP